MKECRLKKFKRNNYFYGKLLSVSDFTAEQDYFNHKRRLINRLLEGKGIVRGLKVKWSAGNSYAFDLSAGVALDACGREIVIPADMQGIPIAHLVQEQKDVVFELSKTHRFYLGLKYAEHFEGHAFSLPKADSQTDLAAEHHRIHEGFKLFLTHESKVKEGSNFPSWYRCNIIYEGDGVRIERICPEFVAAGEAFKVYFRLTVLEAGKNLPNKWTITNKYNGCSSDRCVPGEPLITEFPATSGAGTGVYTYAYAFRADDKAGEGFISTVNISMNDKEKSKVPNSNTFHIVENSIAENMTNKFFTEVGAECSNDCTTCKSIYLARVTVTCTDKECTKFQINSIEEVPSTLKDRVYSNETVYNLLRQLEEREKEQRDDLKTTLKNEMLDMVNSEKVCEISTGVVAFGNIDAGKDCYSAEISSGLGSVPFFVDMGLEMTDGKEGFYGDAEFFTGSDKYKKTYPNIVIGAVVNPEKGSFVIGVRRKTAEPKCDNVVIRWWAQRLDRNM